VLLSIAGGVVVLLVGWGWLTPTRVAASASSIDFPDVIRYKAGEGPRAVLVVDLDRDQKLDVVTSNSAANSISVFTGLGNGTFRDGLPVPTKGKAPFAMAVGRFNTDEYPDVATVDVASASATVFLNDGKGTLSPSSSLDTGSGAVAIGAADLNGDGLDDLVAVNISANRVDIFLNQDGKGFGPRASFPTGAASPRGLVIHDFDGDGRPDIATANSRAGSVSLLTNLGKGVFAAPRTYATAAGPESACAGDFDRDGWTDVATANLDSETVSVLRNKKDGSLGGATTYKVRAPQEVHAADMNGDGALDLVVSQPDRDSVALLLNQGDGSFATAFELPVGGVHPASVGAADLDGDGRLDLVTANEGSANVSVLLHGVHVPRIDAFSPGPTTRVSQTGGRLDHNITASFSTALDLSSVSRTTILVYGNQSGYHDTRVDYSQAAHQVTLHPDTGNPFRPGEIVTVDFTNRIRSDHGIPIGRGVSHTFTVQPQRGTGEFVELERVKCDKIPGTVKAADLDGDGTVDIIALCREVDGIRIHLNQGNAKFDFHKHTFLNTGGFGPWDLVPADFNNDGLIDIAVVNTFSSSMAVFRNRGHGQFDAPVVMPCGAGPMGIAAGDLNGDGYIDLVAAAKGFPEVLILMNRGNGEIAFEEPVHYKVAPSPYSVSARDIDSDGAPDLVMTNLESDRGTFLMNRGDGTFRSPQEFPLVLAKALVDDPIDTNNDGKTDIVTVNTASDDISVLLNTGEDKFSARKNIPVGLTPTDQVFGDFNSDGFVDIALTLDGGNVVIMMNKGDGTFAKTAAIPVGRNPTSPLSADLNGDGTLDLVIANQYSFDISILLNLPGKVADSLKPAAARTAAHVPGGHRP
jgi:hypothetical protein